jgi:F-type H+-transporting ATPase subunit epsilon
VALPTHLDLQIVTPDRLVVRERVDEVQIPGSEGYFGVLPGHTPLLAALAIGEMWYRKGSNKTYISLAGGFAEVLPDGVTILARIAERADEIDTARGRGSAPRTGCAQCRSITTRAACRSVGAPHSRVARAAVRPRRPPDEAA